MCGIAGVFSTLRLDRDATTKSLLKMTQALRHRGPDGSGIQIFQHAAMAHTRLAVIDLEGGQQPLFNALGNVCLVFNGEIYNYRELKTHLRSYPFRSHSDTEVIVALYDCEGIEGWRRLRGMFAFALWDETIGRGYLVRDPMGIKPLFYCQERDRLSFASEAKGILATDVQASLNENSLHRLLNFRYLVGEQSLFSDISQLPPGVMLSWQEGRSSLHTINPPDRTASRDLGETFEAAVGRHLVSDVPVACFLSGGIDSALVARVAARQIPLSSFTLAVGDDPHEAANAAYTADWLGISNEYQDFVLDQPLACHLSMVNHIETPKVNALQGLLLAEFTAKHAKVALSGLGGDELFYGYNAHLILWGTQQLQRLLPYGTNRLLASTLLKLMSSRIVWSEPQRASAMLSAAPHWGRVYGLLRNVWDCPTMRHAIYGERMLDSRLPDCFEWLDEHFPSDADAVTAMARFELSHKLVNDLLWQEDRTSMRVGLETRVPFLDWDLVCLARSYQRRELMPCGQRKHALKRYARTVLPANILTRRKSGFQLDIARMAGSELKPVFDEYLSDDRIAAHRLFNASFVHDLRKRAPNTRLRWHMFLLYLMAQTHMFMEVFNVS